MHTDYYPENYGKVIIITYFTIIVLEIIWIVSIISAPLIIEAEGISGKAGMIIYGLFSPLCHQLDDRCFHIDGNKFAVCVRCFGIYSGFFAGTVLYSLIYKGNKFLKMPRLIYFVVSLLLLLADVLLEYFSVIPGNFITRSVTGGLAGLISAFYIVPGVIIFVLEIFKYIKEFK